jgi:hypothetical protein
MPPATTTAMTFVYAFGIARLRAMNPRRRTPRELRRVKNVDDESA